MDGFDLACIAVAVLVPILGGLVSQHYGLGPVPGVIVAVALLALATRVARVH